MGSRVTSSFRAELVGYSWWKKRKKGLGLDGCRVMREGAGKREEGKPLHVVERSEQGEGEGAKMRWKYTSSSPLTVVVLYSATTKLGPRR